MTTREQHIKGLRDLADWLETNPDVPVGEHDSITFQYSVNAHDPYAGNWRRACAAVDRIAALIGSHVAGDDEYRQTERRFGPVRYLAVASADTDDDPGEVA